MKRFLLLALLPLLAAGCFTQSTPAANVAYTPSAIGVQILTPSPTSTTAPPTPEPTKTATAVPASPTVKSATPTPNNFTPVPLGTAKEIARGNAQRKEIALTFDAGSGATHTQSILKTLRDNHITSTLFLTGQWVENNPQLVKQMVADGHELANHTYSHPDLTTVSDAEIVNQFSKVEKAVQSLVGKTTKPFFRPPFGARNQRVLSISAGQGYQSVYWTFDSGDWREDFTAQMVYNKVISEAVNGAIIVMHLDSQLTAEVLPKEIEQLKAKGYSFVTVSQIMRP